TGKTTELVARVVALVRSGRTTLDRILAVTFTDLAAGEMKLRLRGELESARRGATLQEQERLTAALARLEAAAIGTIHSFCADLPEGGRRLRRRQVRGGDTPPRELLRGAGRDLAEHRDFDGAWKREPFDRDAGLERIVQRLAEVGELAARAQRPEEWGAQALAEIARFVAEVRRRESMRGRDADGLEAELYELSKRRQW